MPHLGVVFRDEGVREVFWVGFGVRADLGQRGLWFGLDGFSEVLWMGSASVHICDIARLNDLLPPAPTAARRAP